MATAGFDYLGGLPRTSLRSSELELKRPLVAGEPGWLQTSAHPAEQPKALTKSWLACLSNAGCERHPTDQLAQAGPGKTNPLISPFGELRQKFWAEFCLEASKSFVAETFHNGGIEESPCFKSGHILKLPGNWQLSGIKSSGCQMIKSFRSGEIRQKISLKEQKSRS